MNRQTRFSSPAFPSSRAITPATATIILALALANLPLLSIRSGALAKMPPPAASLRGGVAGLKSEDKASKPPRLAEGYGRLPLSFEENEGQTDSRVQFLSRGSGYSIFLTPTESVLVSGGQQRRRVAIRGHCGRSGRERIRDRVYQVVGLSDHRDSLSENL
jgi:hypothetical protein